MERRDIIRILLIEDNAADAEFVQEMLKQSGTHFSVHRVDRLSQGLDFLNASAVDVVLLDLSLPDSQGVDTFERLLARAPKVPVIVLTCTKDDRLATAAVRKGAQDYLVKWDLQQDLMERSIRYAIERKAAEEALRETEERYALAVGGANDGLWDWDLRKNTIYLSPRCATMVGREYGSLGSRPSDWFALIHPEDIPQVQDAVSAHLEGATPHLEIEYRSLHRDGSFRWVMARGLAVRDGEGRAYRMAGSLTDVTQWKQAEQALLHSAFHDDLTGLPNRALFLDRLGQTMIRSQRRSRCAYAVLFMDLDRFKNINDSLGHGIGDQLLVAIARRLQTLVRRGDTIARLGGDEFVILVTDIKPMPDACRIAQRLLRRLESPFHIESHEVFTTASIGIAVGATHYRTPEEILRDADTAMYRAKARGKACYEVFDGLMHHNAVALLALETDLRRALERGEFEAHFQPIVDIRNGTLSGFEALVRWRHPTRGLLKPCDFLGIAEETGLIVPLGNWVLTEACLQATKWQQYCPSLSVSVNISPRQLKEPDIVEVVASIIDQTGISPSSLILEMIEGVITEDTEGLGEKLLQLRALGVRVFIDDFGTGYSSLSHLQRLPYDTLKIDRSFVRDIGHDASSGEIIQAIVALARNLGMCVVAEGIETEEQLKVLRSIGCDLGQGFWFSAPLESSAAQALLMQQPEKWLVQ